MRNQGSAISRIGGGTASSSRGQLKLAKTAPVASAPRRSRDPRPESLARLAELLAAHTPYDGSFLLGVPGVHAIRRSTVSRDMVRATVSPALCIVAQGAKVVVLGRQVFAYDSSRMIAYSVELPVAAQIVRASHREPFLALKLDLHGYKLAELSLKVFPHGVPSSRDTRGVCVGQATTAIVDAASRLVELMADPTDAELFAPLVVDEILMRLLRSPIGPRVAPLGQQESGVQSVTKAITWVRENFAQPIKVDELANLANMSPSSFHQHFKAVTAMSPLQYQKVLRLHEARRLMLARIFDAGSAGRQVGYLSASQFSREYTRLFGSAPTRDIARLREDPAEAAHAPARRS
jgi:AraC-like DNA-binding protein